jgi:TfoX/Sxy family transcriptional regulator of competence genes
MAKKKPRPPFLDIVEAKLGHLPGFRLRPMFGGYCIYLDKSFFAVVDESRIYFRVTDETQPSYVAKKSKPFEYAPGKVLKRYYEVPKSVWNDEVTLTDWALRAAMR